VCRIFVGKLSKTPLLATSRRRWKSNIKINRMFELDETDSGSCSVGGFGTGFYTLLDLLPHAKLKFKLFCLHTSFNNVTSSQVY
jgi:hypothetical protein